ncbi:hypothetical protein [Stenotrophomonas sp. ZAC14A_NAIMI4_1]|uniref:hypothetical protein n=1 Tax=Stenotrophomonas sp. ZAC14A_NAIMI4_1 TaxID=2072412 RepID=UPI000D542497|nr:hypothetical protein [Stenotrophomonas sp. ZAC14A_NAIMI4_1]AWH45413.1 hypothetical protein C1926_10420 [Stenotrophomonas sp. ZAC14A_NAIMI4_1]
MSDNQAITTTELTIHSSEQVEAAPLSEHRRRLNELAQRLSIVVQQKRDLLSKVHTMQRARQAAQGDATAARQQWSAKLRDSDGTLTRDIQKLRANERSALSLAEEYEAMEGGIAAEVPRLELELAEAAKDCISEAHEVISEAAGQAYEQFLEQAGESLAVALALFCKAENEGGVYRQKAAIDDLAKLFFSRLSTAVLQRLGDASVADQVTRQLALPPMDLSSVDMGLAGSVARRSQLRAQIKGGGAA